MSKKSKWNINKIMKNIKKKYKKGLSLVEIQKLITVLCAIFLFSIILINIDFSNKKKGLFPAPELSDGMIPIVYNETEKNWITASEDNWYNYDEQKWANVVLVTTNSREKYTSAVAGTPVLEDDILAYLVWIPRYRYKLFNVDASKIDTKEIEIEFETKNISKSKGKSNGEWLTHPAFTFGSKELNGYWVGKFETTGTADLPTIKPNVEALRYQTINNQFNTAKLFSTNIYGLTNKNDAHMMKNIEWGAVSYLSQSKYGKYGNPTYTNEEGLEKEVWINNSLAHTTGCAGDNYMDSKFLGCEHTYETTNGLKTSTTGNIYGIYDMVGGTWEYVMGNMKDENGNFTFADSGFTTVPDSKYYDSYSYSESHIKQEDYNRRILGDATGETRNWTNDYAFFIGSDTPWFIRGGDNCDDYSAGMFIFYGGNGYYENGYFTFREVVLGN